MHIIPYIVRYCLSFFLIDFIKCNNDPLLLMRYGASYGAHNTF
jgi:hypothetical protein